MVHIFVSNRADGRPYHYFGSVESQLEMLKERYIGEEYKVYNRNISGMNFNKFVENINDGDVITSRGIETMFLNAEYTGWFFHNLVKLFSDKNVYVDIVELGKIGQFNTKTAREDANFNRLMNLLMFEMKRVEALKAEMKRLGMVDSDVKNYYFLNSMDPETAPIRYYSSVLEDVIKYGASVVRNRNIKMFNTVGRLVYLG